VAGERIWLSIQHLRGLAALSVALFHACQWSRLDFDIGGAGVDVFFVISGFVMWTVTAGKAVRPLDFLRRRFVRVVPLYWLITLALAAAALVFPARFPEVQPEPAHLLASMAFIQHYSPAGQPFPLLPPGWTLNYEAAFYLVFAAALLLPGRWRLAGLAATLTGVGLVGFVWPPIYVLLANPLVLEFLAGVLIAWLVGRGRLPGRSGGGMLIGAGALIFALIQLSGVDAELWRPMVWGAPAAMLVAGAVAVEADGGWPAWPGLKTLGDASYSLYLVHTLSIGALAMTLGAWNPPLFIPLALAVATGSGLACWALIERPMLKVLRSPLA